MVGNGEQALLTQAQPLAFHGSADHLEGLACAHFVCQQRITAVQHMGDGVLLMFPEGDFRIHAAESDMASVILTGPHGVELLVVELNQRLTALRIFPNPFLERILDGLLFLLGQGGFLLVQDMAFFAVRVLNGIIDPDIPEVQGFFQNLICAGTGSAVGHIGVHIPHTHTGLAGDVPLSRKRREFDLNITTGIVRRIQQFLHKLLNILLVDPGCTQTHIDFRCFQVFGLGGC